VTSEGRALVASLGFLSILAFAGILVNAGSIVAVIYEDLLARCCLKSLTHPLVGCVLWAGISAAWTFYLADRTLVWWNNRLIDFEVDPWDSVWFAFISTTTIGLGDFFLQPEVIFIPDLFRFSLLFLTGFVFLSTFLGLFGDLIGGFFPNAGEKLKERVSKAKIVSFGTNDEASEESREDSKTVETLRLLLENDDRGSGSVSSILEELELLKKLLERAADRLPTEELEG
jgi:hypothetical protein